MIRCDDRILVTHVGSLPRPASLRDLLVRQDRGEAVDAGALEGEAAAAIRHVVARQLAAGIDIGNDGEMPRPGFSTYVAGRMRGFGGASTRRLARDLREHPDFEAMLAQRRRDTQAALRLTRKLLKKQGFAPKLRLPTSWAPTARRFDISG